MTSARLATALALFWLLAAPAGAHARSGHHHRHSGHHHYRHHYGHHHYGHYYGPRVFFGGSFFWPYSYSYPYPYYAPYPVWAYPPPAPSERGAPPAEKGQRDDARTATYGLVQLRGVPDGAAVELDDRFWLTAEALDERWLAVPEGGHTFTVRVEEAEPVERRVVIQAGKTHVVRFAGRHAG